MEDQETTHFIKRIQFYMKSFRLSIRTERWQKNSEASDYRHFVESNHDCIGEQLDCSGIARGIFNA